MNIKILKLLAIVSTGAGCVGVGLYLRNRTGSSVPAVAKAPAEDVDTGRAARDAKSQALIQAVLKIGTFKTSAQRVSAVAETLRSATDLDFAASLSAINEAFGKDRRLFNEVFHAWCERNPEAAAKWALSALGEGRERRLLIEKAGMQWASVDFKAALAWMQTLPDIKTNWPLAAKVLGELAATDPELAYNYLLEMGSGRLSKVAAGRVFEAWIAKDVGGAFTVMGEMFKGSEAYYAGLKMWGKGDPDGAIGWIISSAKNKEESASLALSIAGQENPRAFADALYRRSIDGSNAPEEDFGLESILCDWSEKAPEEVSSWLSSISDPGEKTRVAKLVLATDVTNDGKKAFAWKLPFIAALSPESARQAALIDMAREWAFEDPEAALKWTDTISDPLVEEAALVSSLGSIAKTDIARALSMMTQVETETGKRDAIKEIVTGWAESDPLAALQWSLHELKKTEEKEIVYHAARAWAVGEPVAAIDWLNNNRVEEDFVTSITYSVINHQVPETAIKILGGINDPLQRDAALAGAAEHWLILDRKAARDWIPKSDLSESQKKRLMSLEPPVWVPVGSL